MAKTADFVATHVLCRECNILQKGKVRVRCSTCGGEAFLLEGDPPEVWEELSKHRMEGDCFQCEQRRPAHFYTKCSNSGCGSTVSIIHLALVRHGYSDELCSTCGDSVDDCLVLQFPCGECVLCAQDRDTHKVETSCFAEYCRMNIGNAARALIIDGTTGTVTFGCPNKHKGSSVSDINHFRLAGRKVWDQYKDIAATRVVEEQCPRCNCGIVGIPEGNRVECPGCGHGFCRKRGCYQEWPLGQNHVCQTTRPSIQGSKICPTPGCTAEHIHYFKHECHHIGSHGGCPLCGAHFCYQCLTIQDCSKKCEHGVRDRCPCPLFCPDDRSCGCPVCSGCTDYGGTCEQCNECKGSCKHRKN